MERDCLLVLRQAQLGGSCYPCHCHLVSHAIHDFLCRQIEFGDLLFSFKRGARTLLASGWAEIALPCNRCSAASAELRGRVVLRQQFKLSLSGCNDGAASLTWIHQT